MENETFNDLRCIGYNELNETDFEKAICEGTKSVQYTKIVEWMTKELQLLYCLDEHVNAVSSDADSSLFLMEISSFLKEIGCQYTSLMEGHVNERLFLRSNRILLLNYLLTELKSARMIQVNKPDTALQVMLNESSTATDLKNLLMMLRFPKPPSNIPSSVLFNKVQEKLKEVISKVPSALLREPLFTGKLSDKQWHNLNDFYEELYNEYRIRREMLLKRLDVTIQSFEWSDRLKNKSNEIKNSFIRNRSTMALEPNVRLSNVLAARTDLAILEKTSSSSVRLKTQCEINKFLIGTVPDRGGRPYEQEPPPPEMPSWKNRAAGSGTGTGGRSNNFRGSKSGNNFNENRNTNPVNTELYNSGRVQAGWSNSNQNSSFQNDRRPTNAGNYPKYSNHQIPNANNYGNNTESGYYQSGNNFDNRSGNTSGYNRGRRGSFQDRNNFENRRNY